jgi:uncharacterized protein YuzE
MRKTGQFWNYLTFFPSPCRIQSAEVAKCQDIPPFIVETVDGARKIFKYLEEAVKVIYDPEVDILQILLSNSPVQESDEEKPGVIFDYDRDGNFVGMVILDASKHIENPRSLEYAVTS